MTRPRSILLCCVLLAGVLINTVVFVQLQRFQTKQQLHMRMQWSSIPRGAGWPDTPLPTHAWPESASRSTAVKDQTSGSSAAPEPNSKDDLKLDVRLWLSFAAANAAQEGTEVSESCQRSHGAAFVDRFRSTCKVLCGKGPTMPAQGQQQHQQVQTSPMSQVDCCTYPVDHGSGLACRSANIVLNTTAFMGFPPPEGEPSHAGYLPRGTPGSVQLQCHMPHLTTPIAQGHKGRADSAAGAGPAAANRRMASMDRQLHSEQLPWFTTAVQQEEPRVIHDSCSSGGDVISHPVMFVTRLDPTNPYHHTQSLVQAFLTLGVFNSSKNLPGLQVILADHFIPGPYLGIWQRLGNPYPVLMMDDPALADRHLCFTNSIHAHYVEPGKAFLGYEGVGAAKACPSIIIMAVSHWARYLFREMLPAADQRQYDTHRLQATIDAGTKPRKLQPDGPGNQSSSSSRSWSHGNEGKSSESQEAEPANGTERTASVSFAGPVNSKPSSTDRKTLSSAPGSGLLYLKSQTNPQVLSAADVMMGEPQMPPQHRRLNVVWLSRSWFGRMMKAGGGLTGWQASRDMSHDMEDAIVKALELAVMNWNEGACAPPTFGWWQKPHTVPPARGCRPTNVSFNFRAVELSVEDLHPDQVVLLTRTAVLVGIHGAALANMLWMRPHRGTVVELGMGGNFHYENMAVTLGHRHWRLSSGPDMGSLTDAVKQAMDHVSTRY